MSRTLSGKSISLGSWYLPSTAPALWGLGESCVRRTLPIAVLHRHVVAGSYWRFDTLFLVAETQVSDNAAATAEPESKLDSPSGDGGLKGTTTTAKPESNLTSPSEAGVPDSSTTAKSKWKLGHPSEYCLQGGNSLD